MQMLDRDGRWNWIDSNNVFVGFCNYENCCESFGWFYSTGLPSPGAVDGDIPNDHSTEGYCFDTSYFHDHGSEGTDDGGAVSFLLAKPNAPSFYLTIYNHQNGYYSHGFEMKDGQKVLHDGSL